MLSSQLIPFRFQETQLNVIQLNEEPWFIAKEVCDVLNHSDTSMATRSLDEDEKLIQTLFVSGQNRQVTLINESGLYSLILRSKKAEAKEFKRWVTHEVLPAIRRHGGYLTPEKTEELIANPDLIIQLATTLKKERADKKRLLVEIDTRNDIIEEQQVQLRIQSPSVEYYRKVLNSTDTVSTNVIAKELGMSAVTLNRILHKEYSVIYKQSGVWLPYARFQDLGYTKTKTFSYTGSDGSLKTNISMVWTQAGRRFIHGLWSLRK